MSMKSEIDAIDWFLLDRGGDREKRVREEEITGGGDIARRDGG